ncbi:MAG: DUF2141 domain-containing protein [Pseudomonadales bacterium]|nr:DUF2141 domain-containing protein [Pseudomonadales bacterium]
MRTLTWYIKTLAAPLVATAGAGAFAANLAIGIDNITEDGGVLRIAVYEAANWLDEDPAKVIAGMAYDLADREGDEPVVVNFDLEPGEYAAVVYHDVNANHVFDKNFLGIPKEPYAFSRGFRKMRRPDFEDCKFVVGEDGAAITLALRG